MFNCTECKEPPYAERHVRWCERSENKNRKKLTISVFLLLDCLWAAGAFSRALKKGNVSQVIDNTIFGTT